MASSKGGQRAGDRVEWVPLNGEVRGVRVDEAVSQLIEQGAANAAPAAVSGARVGADARPCGGLLDLYVTCAKEYNIELCDDEKFLYRKCIRDFVDRGKAQGARGNS